MALTYSQLSAITRNKFVPKLIDNIFDSNPLLKRMKAKRYIQLDGGLQILAPLNYAQATASDWYSGSDTLDNTDNDIMTAAAYSWKQLYGSISISRRDELENAGDSQVISLVRSKVQIVEKTLKDKMGTALYNQGSDTDADALVGLRDICATDQTVGGISQTTNSWWQSNVDTSTTTLTIAAMQSQMTAASIDNEVPSVIMTTRSLFDSYHGLLQPQQRFADKMSADGGFSSLLFHGAPVLPDSHCPASHMFFLNENALSLWVHKQENFRFEDFAKPLNQNIKIGHIFWMGAFGSDNNRLHAVNTAMTS